MSWLIDAVRPARALGFGALATLAAGGMAACGSSTAVTPTTTLVGVMADSVENGVLTMTVATGSLVTAPSSWGVKTLYAATVVDVTGTLAIQGGATVALTGTYNSGTHVIEAAGGGYTFTGTVAGNALSGTFTNPDSVTGGFTSKAGSSTSVVAYCGAWTDDSYHTGPWNVTTDATDKTVTGVAADPHVSIVASITGTISGDSLSGSVSSSDGHHIGWLMILSGTDLTGTYTDSTSVSSGGLTGSKCS